MSIHLRIASTEERRPSHLTKARSLIRSSEPPNSPSARKTICEAIEIDGRPCNLALEDDREDWCNRHAQDLRDLNMAWDKIQKEAEKMDVKDAKSAKNKIDKLHLAINLRRRLRERFHTRGVDTVDFMKWFAKIEQDTSALADSILRTSPFNLVPKKTPTSWCLCMSFDTRSSVDLLPEFRSPEQRDLLISTHPIDGTCI
jgi:hypothetical protein